MNRCPVCNDPPAKRRVTCGNINCAQSWRAHRIRVKRWWRRLEAMERKYGEENAIVVWLAAYLARPGVFTKAASRPREVECC